MGAPPAGGPPDLAGWKIWTGGLEKEMASASHKAPRPANIDPGTLSMGNLVLASTKDAFHRVTLGRGIFAEVTLIWKGAGFTALPWTYPDYAAPAALDFFTAARSTFSNK